VVATLGASFGPHAAADLVGLVDGDVLAARAHEVDLVLDAAGMQVTSDSDQRSAGEVRDRTERVTGLR
jgi:hypothetical protein